MKLSRFSPDWLAVIAIIFGTVTGPGRAIAQRPLGVDVSSYQGGSVNWSSVQGSGISFAWAKACQGTPAYGYGSDGDFTINENNGKAAGVYMGAYYFAQPNDDTPAAAASYFWSIAGGYIKADGLTLMPMLDMEVFSGNVGASSYADWDNQWCQAIVNDVAASSAFAKPVIYISACHADELDSSVSQWYNDIADYNGESSQSGTPWSVCSGDDVWGSGVWNFWQYDDTASLAGFPGEQPDVDVFNGTAGTLAANLLVTSLNYAIYTWDPQGTGGGNPYTGSMAGTWENSSWSTTESGQGSPTGWTEGKAACFGVRTGKGTPAFTVTMNNNHNVAGIFDGALAPNSCNVTITGSGVIELSGVQGFDSENSTDGSDGYITINNAISGSGQVVLEGNGQLYFNGVNTYSGGTQVGYNGNGFNGIVNFNNGASFGAGAITLTTYGSGGALVAEGTSAMTIPNNVTLQAAATYNFVGTTGGVTYSGNWSLGGNLLTFETGSTAGKIDNISGVMSGSAGLTVADAGTLILSGVNTYTGNTTITSPAVLSIGVAGQLNSGAYANNIANGGAFNYSSSAAQTLSGVISGGGAFNVSGPGTLTLSGANTFTAGVSINGGVLNVGSSGALYSSGTITFGGGTLQYSSANTTDYSSRFAAAKPYSIDVNGQTVTFATALGSSSGGSLTLASTISGGTLKLSGVNTYNGLTTINSGSALSITGAGQLGGGNYLDTITDDGSFTYNSTASQTLSGMISGSGALTQSGSGMLKLAAANTYGGTTTISAGTLQSEGSSVGNPYFAAPGLAANGFAYTPLGATWTFSSAGIATNGSPWYVPNTPSPATQAAFIQATGAYISQSILFPTNGTYTVSWSSVGRGGSAGPKQLEFEVDGTVIGSPFTPSQTAWTTYTAHPTLTAGYHTVEFMATSVGTGDLSSCITSMQISGLTNGVLPNGAGAGNVFVTGTLDINGVSETINGLSGGGSVLSSTGSASLAVGGNNQTSAFNGVIKNGGGTLALTKIGAGTLTLGGADTYTGSTTISAGTLALGSGGAINSTPIIAIAAGGTLDVSAIASYTLSGNTTLSASGTASRSTIKGGTTVSLGSRPITLNYDGSHPALAISQGTLSLNGNAFTVNGSQLGIGTYTIIQQASGSIASAGSFSVTGTAIGASGTTAFISVSGGIVNLTIANIVPVTINGIALLDNGTVQMNFTGTPEYVYVIEATTNLTLPITWTTLSTNTADANGVFNFVDVNAPNYTDRFYRTMTQ